jgi:enterobactin synthetase component D / holo-[acyl-carrier protein] synthase
VIAQILPLQVRWDRLLFSAKEAAYKAWFPLTGATPGFADVEMTEPEDVRFTLHLLTPGREPTRPWPPRLEGGWLAGRG